MIYIYMQTLDVSGSKSKSVSELQINSLVLVFCYTATLHSTLMVINIVNELRTMSYENFE